MTNGHPESESTGRSNRERSRSRFESALESGSLLRTCMWEDEEECRCARVDAAGTSGLTDTRVQISTPDRPRVCVVARTGYCTLKRALAGAWGGQLKAHKASQGCFSRGELLNCTVPRLFLRQIVLVGLTTAYMAIALALAPP